MNTSLAGQTVLVTRPSHQSGTLCRYIEAAGGTALTIPALEIVPLANAVERGAELVADVARYDIIIFVSANAVEQALRLLAPAGLPATSQLAAIGSSTAAALEQAGYHDVVSPSTQYDSDGLLVTPLFQNIAKHTVAIIRGKGGREYLSQKLREKGAMVAQFELYQRCLPESSREPLQQALSEEKISLVTASSNNGLTNLLDLAGRGGADKLRALPLVVLSQRNRDFALQQGFVAPIAVAERADDQAIVQALINLSSETGFYPGCQR